MRRNNIRHGCHVMYNTVHTRCVLLDFSQSSAFNVISVSTCVFYALSRLQLRLTCPRSDTNGFAVEILLALYISTNYLYLFGGQWLRCCATNRKVAGWIPAGVIGIFHWHKILPIALWPWRRLSLWQKWVPRVFSGGKGGRCVRLTTLPPSCAVVMKSGNLNFLESSGPLQACNGTDLPLLLFI